MNSFSGWLRQCFSRMSMGLRRFMTGRYGHDKLNMVILTAGLVMSILGVFVPQVLINLLLTVGSLACLIWSMCRCMSRNTYKRYEENRRFLLMLDRLKDKTHRYYNCPRCRQTVRVPRGKGKIAITCPKCREKFIKKT